MLVAIGRRLLTCIAHNALHILKRCDRPKKCLVEDWFIDEATDAETKKKTSVNAKHVHILGTSKYLSLISV